MVLPFSPGFCCLFLLFSMSTNMENIPAWGEVICNDRIQLSFLNNFAVLSGLILLKRTTQVKGECTEKASSLLQQAYKEWGKRETSYMTWSSTETNDQQEWNQVSTAWLRIKN